LVLHTDVQEVLGPSCVPGFNALHHIVSDTMRATLIVFLIRKNQKKCVNSRDLY